MMQESGGRGLDPMQAAEGSFNTKYPHKPNGIKDPEYSIQCGVQELKAALTSAEVESPIDMEHIKLALQGYNFGNGYISWAKTNYGGYSYANAVEFSTTQASRLGWSSYGDTQYVSHVLRYYPYGRAFTAGGNQAIVEVALTQLGNQGGQPYWSWYGFNSRVEWCACFVSWCADQCGYIESGLVPKFAGCVDGANWFKSNGKWQDRTYEPKVGDIIFFDWEGDGTTDHVGIVEKCENGTVYTVEGRAAFKKYLKMGGQLPAKERKSLSVKKTSLPVANEIEKVQPKDFDKSKFEITLLRRYRNGMQFDSIDFENFREMYDALFDETLTFDDEALEERLRYCGVLYKDRLFPAEGIIDNNTKETLFAYIDNCFSTGKSVLYYKAIYQDLSDAFASCFTLADEKMLKAYIEYSAEKDKYYYFSDYMSVDRNVKIDHTEEIEEYFLSAGKPMRLDDVFSTLSHIPQERVDRIIKTDSRFLRNSKGEYFHTDIFEITDDELENIAEIIEGFISEDEYAIWTNVWNMIQDKFPLFVENNLYLSGLGIRNAIEQRFSGRFRFEGAVISLPKDSFSMRDVYQLYAKHHAEFTADEIYILSKELDTVIYFDALSEVSVRVSHDLFVSKKRINFDVDSVDKVIESFMSKDYIRIREIDSFLAFPSVGYEWNEYMLESFLISYSKKFVLLNNGQSLHNVAGAIVKKDGKIKEFEDACAAVLSESRIELKKSEALNYLADVNMITRRSYKDLDTAMRKATQIRNRKE